MDHPGPYCAAAGIKLKDLESNSPQVTKLTNGIVLELFLYTKKSGQTFNQFCQILERFEPTFKSVNPSTLSSRVNSVLDKKKKLVGRKKVKGVKNVSELLQKNFSFEAPLPRPQVSDVCTNKSKVKETKEKNVSVSESQILQPAEAIKCKGIDCASQTQFESTEQNCVEDTKCWNFNKYLINKQQRKLTKLTNEVQKNEQKLQMTANRLGHYSMKNVNKRDETSKKNLHLLRNSQRLVKKQTSEILKLKEKNTLLQDEVKELETTIASMNNQFQEMTNKLRNEHVRKINAQKMNSKLRNKVEGLRKSVTEMRNVNETNDVSEKYHVNEKIASLNSIISEKDLTISDLEQEIVELKANSNKQIITKNQDGSYNDKIRLCIIQLVGLEVATEKVTPVIEVVAENIFEQKFLKNELPNSTTVQTIVDEGHYLAKAFIASKIEQCENWGVNRDGTTRKKQKIVGTAVTLDNGEIASLGFTHVSKETAKVITDVTKDHLTEMASIHSDQNKQNTSLSEDFIVTSLCKLAFTMSDRASNEKLANKLLNEWRDDILDNCQSDTERDSVNNFHCMAHVLLGFHKYVCDDLKGVEKELTAVHGPIGRDVLPQFKFWAKRETVAERVVRTTSETFGPAGDHLGLRDRWEAFCAEKGIKSTIGNFKDNRFNGIFENAAQILIHQPDFLTVIATVDSPNNKLKAVEADLRSSIVKMVLISLAVVYVKITGPYWELITSGKVAYLKLYPFIQNLHSFLKECAQHPHSLKENEPSWIDTEFNVPLKSHILETINKINIDTDIYEIVTKSVCLSMVRTIEKQLEDFLSGGKFTTGNERAIKQTEFANITNLSCEHHFGDLDSSQKRRPNASFHHHSSVQLLKRNRKKLKEWYEKMTHEQRMKLWRRARKGGKELRKKHKLHEKRVVEEIQGQMKEKPKKKRKIEQKENANCCERDQEGIEIRLPDTSMIKCNDYVIVAYQDRWYPGCVLDVNSHKTIVKFLSPCRKSGVFVWPPRNDIQEVKPEFIIESGVIPECVSSGRQWFFADHQKFSELYENFKQIFF